MSLAHTNLVAYRSSVVTPDTAEALRHVEASASRRPGVRIHYAGIKRNEANWAGATGSPHLSMRPSGREVRLRIAVPEGSREDEVALLWGIAVPLGFTPWNRYPVPGPEDDLFHYLGPWQMLFDHLCGEARGELAWPSVCCAAQSDVGAWEGDRRVERFVQAQLHRLGLHCGPVDGVIGERTAASLRALGATGRTLDETAEALAKFRTPKPKRQERRHGHIVIDGDDVAVFSYGKVATMRTKQGVALTIDGPGKVVLDIGQET